MKVAALSCDPGHFGGKSNARSGTLRGVVPSGQDFFAGAFAKWHFTQQREAHRMRHHFLALLVFEDGVGKMQAAL